MSRKKYKGEAAPAESTTDGRMVSVDALRGFDMFWITGGEAAIVSLATLCGGTVASVIGTQFDHAEWEGFRFYDLIFPLFLFLIGVSITFSLGRIKATGDMGAVYRRIFKRTAILFIVGLIYYGGFRNEWPEIRIAGVLQRMALCYFFGSLAFCLLSLRGMIILCVSILIGYWALLSFVPVPGLGTTTFEVGKNWACYIDFHYLPGRLNDGTWDPEGILSTIPAVATCLLGIFSGLLITSKLDDKRKVLYLVGGGALLVVLGFAWGLQFPVIKKIWTSSYVLVAGGYSAVLLGAFYQIVDVWKIRTWTIPFVWIGANPLAIYLARNFFKFDEFSLRFVGGDIQRLAGPTIGPALLALTSLGLTLLFARFLYKHKIFIRL